MTAAAYPKCAEPWGVDDWRRDAACAAADPNRFCPTTRRGSFHEREGRKVAREFCEGCPVRVACAAWGRVAGNGVILGGMWFEDRNPPIDLLAPAPKRGGS